MTRATHNVLWQGLDDDPAQGGNGDGFVGAREMDSGEDYDGDRAFDVFEDFDHNHKLGASEDLDSDGHLTPLGGCEGRQLPHTAVAIELLAEPDGRK